MRMRKTLRCMAFCAVLLCLFSVLAVPAYADGYDPWPEPFTGDVLFTDPRLSRSTTRPPQAQPLPSPAPADSPAPASTAPEPKARRQYIPEAMPQEIGRTTAGADASAVPESPGASSSGSPIQTITNLNTTPTEKTVVPSPVPTASPYAAAPPALTEEPVELTGENIPRGPVIQAAPLQSQPAPEENPAPEAIGDPAESPSPAALAVPLAADAKPNPETSDSSIPGERLGLLLSLAAVFTGTLLGQRLLQKKQHS